MRLLLYTCLLILIGCTSSSPDSLPVEIEEHVAARDGLINVEDFHIDPVISDLIDRIPEVYTSKINIDDVIIYKKLVSQQNDGMKTFLPEIGAGLSDHVLDSADTDLLITLMNLSTDASWLIATHRDVINGHYEV